MRAMIKSSEKEILGILARGNKGFWRSLLLVTLLTGVTIAAPLNIENGLRDESDKGSFKRCWSIPGAILAEQGVSADESQAYYVDRDAKIVAVDISSGNVAWTADAGGKIHSELVVANGRVLVIASPLLGDKLGRSILRSFSSRTGLSLWNAELPTADRYYLSGEEDDLAVVSTRGNVWLLNADGGTIRWNSSANGLVSSHPRIDGGRLLIALDGKRVEERSLANGEKVATAEVDGVPAFVGVGKSSAAVYSDDRGNVHSIQMGGGKNWNFRVGGRVVYIRSVNENVLLGSADNFVYFMSVEYGNLLWKRRLPARIASGGLLGDDLAIFTVIGERSAYLVELDKGKLVDKLDLTGDDAFLITPIKANGKYLIAATVSGLSGFSTSCEQ